MATVTLQQIEREVRALKTKVQWLERVVVVPADDEGLYKKSFVKKVLRHASESPHTFYEFVKPGDFLNRTRSMR